MTTMIVEIYDALRDAGASDDKARRAAEALSGHEDRFDRLEQRIERLDHRMDLFDAKFASLEQRVGAMIQAATAELELKFARLEAEFSTLKWMMGFMIALMSATLLKSFFH